MLNLCAKKTIIFYHKIWVEFMNGARKLHTVHLVRGLWPVVYTAELDTPTCEATQQNGSAKAKSKAKYWVLRLNLSQNKK